MDENTNIGPVSMEDSRIERARKREKKKKKFNIIKIILIVVLVGVVAFFSYKAYLYIIRNKDTSNENISYTAAAQSKAGYFKNFLVTTTIDGVKIINQNGEDVLGEICAAVSSYVKGMNEPVFVTNNKIMLIYDIRGKSAILFSDNGIIKTFNFENDIIKAKMSLTGQFVFITKDAAMKAAVKLYNADGNELMTWFSGTGYVVDAQISDVKSSMAVLLNEVIDSRISSKILFFTFDNPEPYMGKVLGETVANYVSFFGESSYIVCENCLFFIDSEGNLNKISDFGKNQLKYFHSFKNGNIMLCFNTEGEQYNISVYNKNGKETGNFMIDSFMSVSDTSDNEFLVLKRKSILSVNSKGKIMRELDCAFDVKNACYYKDKIAVFSPDTILIY